MAESAFGSPIDAIADVFNKRRQQAFEQWSRTAPHQDLMDYMTQASDTVGQQLLQSKAGPSYAEGEGMPSTPAQDRSRDAFFMERNAHVAAGEPDRTDELRNALLKWKELGYYTPDNNPGVPAPSIGGDLSPRPENSFQNDVMGGTPISMQLIPVEHDPFRTFPVEHDPFAQP